MTTDLLIDSFEDFTKRYADTRQLVAERVESLESETQSIYRRRLPGIRKAIAAAQEARNALEREIDARRDCFVKPRSIVLHGIRLGLQKGKGSIDWDDDAALIQRIEKQCPEKYDALVKVTSKPLKKALEQLSTAELKKLGCRVKNSGDLVLIKPIDSDLEKLLKRIPEEGLVKESE